MKNIVLIAFLLFSIAWDQAIAQAVDSDNILSLVGRKMPDYVFNDVTNYTKNKTSLQELKGKWVVLDFWDKGCLACIGNFPYVNKEQLKFKGKFQFMLVGSEFDKKGELKPLFEKLRKKLNLVIPCAFDLDAGLFNQLFKSYTVPKTVVIDPEGIIRFATSGVMPYEDELEELYLNKKVTPVVNYAISDRSVDPDTGVIFQSKLSNHRVSGSKYTIPRDITVSLQSGSIAIKGVSLASLYSYAFTGCDSPWGAKEWQNSNVGFFREPILETKDSLLFRVNWRTSENLFNYTMQFPAGKFTKADLMRLMQEDLKRYFGFEVSIERRKLPYWRLIASERAMKKLRANGDSTYLDMPKTGVIRLKNQPLMKAIFGELISNSKTPWAIVDETGINGNIDISFNIDPTDRNDYLHALKENGLEVVRGEKEMYCIVIRDPKSNSNPSK